MFYDSSHFRFLLSINFFKVKTEKDTPHCCIFDFTSYNALLFNSRYKKGITYQTVHRNTTIRHSVWGDRIRTLHTEYWLSLTEVDKSAFCPNTSDSKLRLRENKNRTFDFLKMLDMTPSAIFWKKCLNAQYLYVNECFNLWAVKRSRRIHCIIFC